MSAIIPFFSALSGVLRKRPAAAWTTRRTTFVPLRTVNFNDQASFEAAMAGAQAGDDLVGDPTFGDYLYDGTTLANGSGETESGWIRLRSSTSTKLSIRPETTTQYSTLPVGNYWICYRLDVTATGVANASGGGHCIDQDGKIYLIVDDCYLHDAGGAGVASARSEFVLVEWCTVENCSATNTFRTSGISVYQLRALVPGTPGPGAIIRHNTCHGNSNSGLDAADRTDGNGIIIDDLNHTQTAGVEPYTKRFIVEGNLCYDNGQKGIQVVWSNSGSVRFNTCVNNTQYPETGGTWLGEINVANSQDIIVSNNIGACDTTTNADRTGLANVSTIPDPNPSVSGATPWEHNTGTIFRNNIAYNFANGSDDSVKTEGGSNEAITSGSNGNLLAANPGFLNAGADDYRLASGSAALDAGSAAYGLPDTDLGDNARIDGTAPDIGAYEGATADPLTAPTSLDSGARETSGATIVSSSISPAANSLIVCGIGARSNAEIEVTLIDPVATFGTSGSWVLAAEQYNDGGAAWVGGGIAMIMTDGAPGSGTITFGVLAGNNFQMVYRILIITGGLVTLLGTYPLDTAEGQATSLSFTMPGVPAASSYIASNCVHNGVPGGSFNVPSGHTEFAAVSAGSNLSMKMAAKLAAGQNFSYDGLTLDKGKVGAAIEVLQA